MIMEDLFNLKHEEEEEEGSDLYHPSPYSLERCATNLSTDSFTYCTSVSGVSDCSDEQHDAALMSGQGTTKQNKAADHCSEVELMKERFAKLLLGEDMSGGGKGVSTAVTISNAITNLYATVFGHNLRLEPLDQGKKAMWRREMECLLAVCDHMVEEFIPDNLQDQTAPPKVMVSRPRSDISINLPALQKLDSILLEILDSFAEAEFCYVEDGSVSMSSTRSGSFRKVVHRNEDKWWVPVPCVPSGGLSEESRKHLRHKRECASQVHKAAMAINAAILADMQVPNSYMAALPKSGKGSVADSTYRYLSSPGDEEFSPDHLLDSLGISSEQQALELADRVEASIHTWRRKAGAKSSWGVMKDVMLSDMDKRHVLADKAEQILFCLRRRYPGMSQTTLDTCKIQDNTDVGQAILESYSRVLEGLAFNIAAWIEDVLYVDTSTRNRETP
uniref:PRONE domain-containing protein n=1 Tax=Kalanchoe fedtschenkoi TaxID=63787 RepID=A0A7N0UQN7_KALFE